MEMQNAEHKLNLIQRNKGHITGIKNVDAFTEEQCVVYTEDCRICIKGHGMHVIHLDVEQGDLSFEGYVDSIVYSAHKTAGQMGTSLMKRMFK